VTGRVHLERDTLLLAENQREVALVVVEVRLEAGDREVLRQVQNGIGHAKSPRRYASDGGTLFLNVIWFMFGCSRDGYIITIDYDKL
jgi:hypothetical protein